MFFSHGFIDIKYLILSNEGGLLGDMFEGDFQLSSQLKGFDVHTRQTSQFLGLQSGFRNI